MQQWLLALRTDVFKHEDKLYEDFWEDHQYARVSQFSQFSKQRRIFFFNS